MASIEREEQHPGKPSLYSCPECQGVLWELEDEDLLRFRCRIGHAYTADALELKQSEQLEQALWTALRSLEESAALHRRFAQRALARRHERVAAMHTENGDSQEKSAHVLRDLLLNSLNFPNA